MSDILRAQLRARRQRPAPEPFRPLTPMRFLAGQPVLAFDATLSHTGWALIEVDCGEIFVLHRGTINPVTERVSFWSTWDKATWLRDALTGVYTTVAGEPYQTVVEAPSVGGGSRTESSLVAGMLVHMSRPAVVAVSATHVSKVFLGDARVLSDDRKKAIRAEVSRLIPDAARRSWNEHQRDAVATGLTYLHDEQERRRALTGAQA